MPRSAFRKITIEYHTVSPDEFDLLDFEDELKTAIKKVAEQKTRQSKHRISQFTVLSIVASHQRA